MPTVMRQGHKLDTSTARRLAWAEDKLGFDLTVVQGSYNAGKVGASAGTHDRGGVVDIRTWDLTPTQRNRALAVLREAGLIAWYRTKAQGFDPHIHAVERASTTLAPSAMRQVKAWEAGRNGLAGNGPDDGPKVDVPIAMPDQSEEDDMTPEQDTLLRQIDRRVLALMGAAERDEAAAVAEVKRDQTDERRTLAIMGAIEDSQKRIRELAQQGLSSNGDATAALRAIAAIVEQAS